MMILVKIQCGCGQPYAFDVEPILGQMPSAIARPSCGADGTAAANAYLAQSSPAPMAAAVAPVGSAPVRVAAPGEGTGVIGRASRGVLTQVVQLDRAQIEQEARAKILWGDQPEEVIKYLVIKGVQPDEAAGVVRVMLKERSSAIRGNGVRKMVIGAVLVGVPIAVLIMFIKIGVISFTIMGITGAVGLWGGWMAFTGIFMLLAPKSEAGDVAEQ